MPLIWFSHQSEQSIARQSLFIRFSTFEEPHFVSLIRTIGAYCFWILLRSYPPPCFSILGLLPVPIYQALLLLPHLPSFFFTLLHSSPVWPTTAFGILHTLEKDPFESNETVYFIFFLQFRSNKSSVYSN